MPHRVGEPAPAGQIPFSNVDHHQEWIRACKTGSSTGSHFGYAAPFTELVLLGNVAYRAGQTIDWDPVGFSTGSANADALLTKEYRSGWEV